MLNQHERLLFFQKDHAETEEWSDDKIKALRSYLLHKTLSAFGDGRVSISVRAESLDWLMEDDIHPFSFRVCCKNENVNPDRVRKKLMELIKQHQIRGH